ncbi:MAG: DUF3465 domain-containing protein [Chthoniobacteraceae bacterium]
MKRLFSLLLILAAAAYLGFNQNGRNTASSPSQNSTLTSDGDATLNNAIANHQRNIQVQGRAVVTRLLADDTEGIRHQKFIIRIASGQTILIAHNIDEANRIDTLRPGDTIDFNGEYEWTPQGGVIHWTHHDSSGRHPSGWIKLNGQTYQ